MTAINRIRKYLEQRSLMRQSNGDIHGLHHGEDREATLTVADIEDVLSQVSSLTSERDGLRGVVREYFDAKAAWEGLTGTVRDCAEIDAIKKRWISAQDALAALSTVEGISSSLSAGQAPGGAETEPVWSPWFEWTGGECPIPWAKNGEWQARYWDGKEEEPAFYAKACFWRERTAEYHPAPCVAFRYRLGCAPSGFAWPPVSEPAVWSEWFRNYGDSEDPIPWAEAGDFERRDFAGTVMDRGVSSAEWEWDEPGTFRYRLDRAPEGFVWPPLTEGK